MSDDRLRGHLRALLLATLASGPAHGYAIARSLLDQTDGGLDIPEGSLYPALHRLEEDDLVASRWEHDGSRRRRLYAITAAGKEVLSDERSRWSSFRRSIDVILEEPT